MEVSQIVKGHLLPFRVGKKRKRAVIDARGQEVVVFNAGKEALALEYVELMNEKYNQNKID
jgi:hypothetical protein